MVENLRFIDTKDGPFTILGGLLLLAAILLVLGFAIINAKSEEKDEDFLNKLKEKEQKLKEKEEKLKAIEKQLKTV